jgi:enamine deaminase RidA (YjgF/YER057c/UK114 family)
MSADDRLEEQAQALGFPLTAPIMIGGDYTPALREGDLVYVSGQIPRIGDVVAVVGSAGADVILERARFAAQISTLRALALFKQLCGSLDAVASVPRMCVFVRSAPDFTQQSEVADAASQLLSSVLMHSGVHTRTSVGVAQLPKGAVVELDFIFKVATCF